jgi:hypothetical protein
MHQEKAAFDNYSVEAIVPNALFCSISVLDKGAVTSAVVRGANEGLLRETDSMR